MADEDDHIKTATCGVLSILEPDNGGGNQAEKSHSSMSRAVYDDGKYKCSSRFSETHEAADFVNKSGKMVYEQEYKYTSTLKYNDKMEDSSNEYQSQVKVKKVVYPPQPQPQPPSKSSGKRIKYY